MKCGLVTASLRTAKRQPRMPCMLLGKQGLSLPAEPDSNLSVSGDRKCVLPSGTLKERERNGFGELHLSDFPLLLELQHYLWKNQSSARRTESLQGCTYLADPWRSFSSAANHRRERAATVFQKWPVGCYKAFVRSSHFTETRAAIDPKHFSSGQ